MKEIKCINCGASQFYYKNGAQVCSYCQSKFEIETKINQNNKYVGREVTMRTNINYYSAFKI